MSTGDTAARKAAATPITAKRLRPALRSTEVTGHLQRRTMPRAGMFNREVSRGQPTHRTRTAVRPQASHSQRNTKALLRKKTVPGSGSALAPDRLQAGISANPEDPEALVAVLVGIASRSLVIAANGCAPKDRSLTVAARLGYRWIQTCLVQDGKFFTASRSYFTSAMMLP
jgi:hypothetical protein